MEDEAKKKQDAMEDEKSKKENYRVALRQQQNQQKMLEKLQKEIEKENERAYLLDMQLKEKEQLEIEKKQLLAKLKEINGVTTPKRERYEILMSEKKKREAERISKWENRDANSKISVVSQPLPTISKNQEETKQDMLIEPTPEKSDHEMMIENTAIDQLASSDHKITTPKRIGQFDDINEIQLSSSKRSDMITEESKGKEEIIMDDLMRKNEMFEDQKMSLEEKPQQKISSQRIKMHEENMADNPVRAENNLNAFKSPSKWLRSAKQPVQFDLEKLKEEAESSNSSNIPIDTSMQICVRNLIRLQLDLVRKLICVWILNAK